MDPHRASARRPAGEKVEKTERLLNLVSCLLAARTPVPFGEIRGKVVGYDDGADDEAMEKRFDRDKAELRALGVPIDYVPMDALGNSGYSIRKDRYFLPEIRLTGDEALVLSVLHRMATHDGAATGPNLLSALQKVSADSPLGETLRSSPTEQHAFGLRPGRGGQAEHENLETLTGSVLRSRPVRFLYYGIGRDRVLDREVEPWGLGYHRGRWYLAGRDRLRGAVRSFRLDRIRGRVRTLPGDPVQVPKDFDVQDHVGRSPWEYEEGRPAPASIRFDPAVAWMVKENLRRGEAWKDEPGGGGVLTLRATRAEPVIRFALKHGRLARVVGPRALKAHYQALLRRTLALHEGPPTKDVGARRGREGRRRAGAA